jgi:hypothetical protein
MSRPYSIELLNELHEHFPDLLYRPQRFQGVPDVLAYIIGVANVNPYQQARDRYTHANREQKEEEHESVDAIFRALYGSVPNPPVRSVGIGASQPLGIGGTSSYRSSFGTSRRMNVIPISSSNSAASLLSTFISGVMGEPIAPNLQSFLDQPVIVHPTEQQLHDGTTLTTARRTQNDACAICQDMIEEGQTMRILNYCTHSFHQECIDTWLRSHVTCPTCRHDIREL